MSSAIYTGAPTPSIVEATDLARVFGSRRALAGVTFSLEPGECLAIFGPNGAGKTTLLRVLAGLLRPTSGGARVAGIQLPGGPLARGRICLISHPTMLYEALLARQNAWLPARLPGRREEADPLDHAFRPCCTPRGDVAPHGSHSARAR